MKFALLEDAGFGFIVEVKEKSTTHVDFEVYEINARTMDNKPFDLELYLTCSIKWDSCSHFWFGEKNNDTGKQNGYLHLCGVDAYKKHVRLLKELYDKAFEIMERDPEIGEEWEEK